MIVIAPRDRADVNYALKTMFDHSFWKNATRKPNFKSYGVYTISAPPPNHGRTYCLGADPAGKGSYLPELYFLKGYMIYGF